MSPDQASGWEQDQVGPGNYGRGPQDLHLQRSNWKAAWSGYSERQPGQGDCLAQVELPYLESMTLCSPWTSQIRVHRSRIQATYRVTDSIIVALVGVWVGPARLAAMVAAVGPAALRLLWLVNMQAVHRWEKFRFFFFFCMCACM